MKNRICLGFVRIGRIPPGGKVVDENIKARHRGMKSTWSARGKSPRAGENPGGFGLWRRLGLSLRYFPHLSLQKHIISNSFE